LTGTLFVQGAKNAILPMIAAALMPAQGQTILRNVPPLNDVMVSLELAASLGANVNYFATEQVLLIDPGPMQRHTLDGEVTAKSRASVLFLAPVLRRFGVVEASAFGGCAIGPRRLDFHYNGFKRLGGRVESDPDGSMRIRAERLTGNLVYLDLPSQTSTENLMMAATVAAGRTIIENAAMEPEVIDFGNMLNQMGARISGVGTATIIIDGVPALRPVEYTVMHDRLDAGSFMMAAAATGGDVALVGACLEHMRILQVKLEQMGADIQANGMVVRVIGPKRPRPVNAVTWAYPGLSTDFLPGLTALATIADGTSYLRENIFDDRFTQIEGLTALGAQIERRNAGFAVIQGVAQLTGTDLRAPDLRAGMSYVTAALAAQGQTTIDNVYQIQRGYAHLVERLRGLGADIAIFDDADTP